MSRNGTSKWLYCTSDNNGVRVGTNTNKKWTITTHSGNPNAFAFKHNSTSRYLGVYNDADWRCYTSLTATNFTNAKGSSQIYLYKKTSGSVAPDTTPKLEVGKTEIELTSDGGEGTVVVEAVNVSSLQVRALAEANSQDEVTWLSVEYDENGTLSYAAEANGSENSREAYVEIYAEDLEGNPVTKYIHVVQAGKSEGGAAVTVESELSFANKANRTTFNSNQQVWEQNGIKLINNQASSTNPVADYANPARFYAGSNLEVTAPGAISTIVFDANSTSYATAMKNSIGTVSGATVTVSSDKVTVTFTSPVELFAVAKFTAQVRMDSITVTYLQQ